MPGGNIYVQLQKNGHRKEPCNTRACIPLEVGFLRQSKLDFYFSMQGTNRLNWITWIF